METTAALTNNTFKAASTGNLNNIDSQLVGLREDYEEMKRTREQAKAALQAKFDEVYEKIKQTKAQILTSNVEINQKIRVFQGQFENEVITLEQEFNDKHHQFKTQTDSHMTHLCDNLDLLDKGIEEEKQDRIRTEQENVSQIQKQLDLLFVNFEKEKNTRVENEKMILNSIDNEAQGINTQIVQQYLSFLDIFQRQFERIKRMKELEQHTKYELQSQDRFIAEFKKKTILEFNQQTDATHQEMDNRFDHQDELVGSLSHVVRTIQNTLKILGKDV